jgi:cytochrome c peroxidase
VKPRVDVEALQAANLAILGQELFFDDLLSGTGRTSCASCHRLPNALADPRRVSIADDGRPGIRNAPAIGNAVFQQRLMWDGRFSTLEEQVLSPFDRGEMGISVETALGRLDGNPRYLHLFRRALGRRPSPEGIAKALAAYIRTLAPGESRFDRFLLDNDPAALSEIEKEGFEVFDKQARCSVCHALTRIEAARNLGYGRVAFTDFGFHNLGVGYKDGRYPDRGRYEITGHRSDLGAFRTPSLRNVAVTAPYMHDGSIATLEEVVEFFDAGGRPNPNLSEHIRPLGLAPEQKRALVAFLRSLTDHEYEEAAVPSR